MGGGLGGQMKKVKGLRSRNWQLQNNHRDVNYSIGNIVIIMYGIRVGTKLLGISFHKLCKCITTMLYT